jgi:ABC-type dipeptide/oligopeptide/nickel transport system permease component
MGRFILLRLLQTIIAIIGISLIVFVLARASGDPTLLLISGQATAEDIVQLRQELGLDRSVPEQYWIFVKSLAHGDLGESLLKRRPVVEMIGERIVNSIMLSVVAFTIGTLLATALGVTAATRRDTWLDNGVKFLAVLGQAMPLFWLAIMAIFIFAVQLRLLPTSGTGSPAHFVLPAASMAFFILPGIMRLVRSSMLDVLDSEYIKLARIKGLPEVKVIWKHALRNALIAPLTMAGMIFANMIAGAIIVETVFSWPGVGSLSYEALLTRDFPVIQGITLMVAALVLLVNLSVDIAYAYIDPQIRYQRT